MPVDSCGSVRRARVPSPGRPATASVGPPTVTDAAVVLGYIDPDYFLGGRMPLDVEAARRAAEIAGQLGRVEEEGLPQS